MFQKGDWIDAAHSALVGLVLKYPFQKDKEKNHFSFSLSLSFFSHPPLGDDLSGCHFYNDKLPNNSMLWSDGGHFAAVSSLGRLRGSVWDVYKVALPHRRFNKQKSGVVRGGGGDMDICSRERESNAAATVSCKPGRYGEKRGGGAKRSVERITGDPQPLRFGCFCPFSFSS